MHAGGPCPARAYSLRATDVGGVLPTYLTLPSILCYTDFPHSLSTAKNVTITSQTALCLQEEYAMQASWIRDEQSKSSAQHHWGAIEILCLLPKDNGPTAETENADLLHVQSAHSSYLTGAYQMDRTVSSTTCLKTAVKIKPCW